MPMKLSTALPVTGLRDYVRGFEQREAHIETNVGFPIAARPHQFLEFYLQGKYLVESCDSRARDVVPQAVVVGPSTYRNVDLCGYRRSRPRIPIGSRPLIPI
jgi:hypothetical protein